MTHEEFEKLYKAYDKRLKYFIYNTAGHDMYVAEDIYQNTMFKVFRYRDTLEDETKFNSWLHTIAWNEAMSYFNRESENKKEYLFDNEENIYDKDHVLIEPDFSVEYLSSEEFLAIINTLSPIEQSIFILHYIHGYKLTEIAVMRGENKNTIKSMYRRGLIKLEKIIKGESSDETRK